MPEKVMLDPRQKAQQQAAKRILSSMQRPAHGSLPRFDYDEIVDIAWKLEDGDARDLVLDFLDGEAMPQLATERKFSISRIRQELAKASIQMTNSLLHPEVEQYYGSDWYNKAQCGVERGDALSDDSEAQKRFKLICARCRVREICLQKALENGDNEYGIWGGLTAAERRKLSKKRSING
jgi:WhiB family transcriptional regulator, redox-sensing transcriptional regulator